MSEEEIARTLRADVERLRAERDELSAEVAAKQRQADSLYADIAAGERAVNDLRAFERDYRDRLAGWVDDALGILRPGSKETS